MNFIFLLTVIGVVSIIMVGISIGETKAQGFANPDKIPTLNQISAMNTGGSGNLIYSSQDLDMDKFTSLLMAKTANDSRNNTNNTSSVLPAAAIGPKIPAKGYLVQEIRDGLYWLTVV